MGSAIFPSFPNRFAVRQFSHQYHKAVLGSRTQIRYSSLLAKSGESPVSKPGRGTAPGGSENSAGTNEGESPGSCRLFRRMLFPLAFPLISLTPPPFFSYTQFRDSPAKMKPGLFSKLPRQRAFFCRTKVGELFPNLFRGGEHVGFRKGGIHHHFRARQGV